jgi:hypothetical protein
MHDTAEFKPPRPDPARAMSKIDRSPEPTRRSLAGLLGSLLASMVAIAAAEAGPRRAPRQGDIRQKYDDPPVAYHSRRSQPPAAADQVPYSLGDTATHAIGRRRRRRG